MIVRRVPDILCYCLFKSLPPFYSVAVGRSHQRPGRASVKWNVYSTSNLRFKFDVLYVARDLRTRSHYIMVTLTVNTTN